MNGWEIKPLGAFAILVLLAVLAYASYIIAKTWGLLPGSPSENA
jgi:hypothetical protein